MVFVSSHTEYSIDGYEVNALRYIDKNSADCERKIFECLDKTAYVVENSLNAYYSIIMISSFCRDRVGSILYYTSVIFLQMFLRNDITA